MKKGSNSVSVACKLELINLIKEFSGKEDQNEGFWLVKRLLTKDEEFRKAFIEKYGEQVYSETVKHYSKTNIEQRAEREQNERERRIRDDAKLKIEQLRLETYQQQVKKQEDNSPETVEELETRIRVNEELLEAERNTATSKVELINLHNQIERDKRELAFKKVLDKQKEGD